MSYTQPRDVASSGNKGWVDGRSIMEKSHEIMKKRLINSNNILKKDVELLEKNGYLILKNVLKKNEIDEIYNESVYLLNNIPLTKRYALGTTKLTTRFYSIVSSSRCYDKLILQERINNICDYYLYKNYLLSVSMLINIKPNEIKQQLHRDNTTFVYGPTIPPKNPLRIQTMWAITDFTETNGATYFVKGSHKWSNKRKITPNDTVVQGIMPAGSVVIWFGSTIHGGGENTSNNQRIGSLISYEQPWIRSQENTLLSMPFDQVKKLPKKIQSLIGYSVHAGSVGVVQGRHPIHFIEKILKSKL